MKECQTPDAVYDFTIKPEVVAVSVKLPFDVQLSEEQAIALENELHDAVEKILAPFFKKR